MLFNSFAFLVFALIVVPLFFLLPHKHRWKLLLVSSCVFYIYLIPAYILVLFAVITIDFFAAIQIEKAPQEHKKKYLLISLAGNLGILFFFKYFNFFIDNVNTLTNVLPFVKTRLNHLDIILPIGLSFHTFQAISYVIEVYKGKQKPEKSYGIYALYVLFFPQLVAGPIERPQNMLHQFHEKKHFSFDNFFSGLRLILWGLFLKSVIADRLAIPVDTVYNSYTQWHGLAVFIATVFFAIQIYCDFAGYSYIAIGIARIIDFKLMTNFKHPYLSKNITEFWKRWHISLSSWFRDYVYIPLGGSKASKTKYIRNIAIVFLLSGFWHGANYTFIAWGLFHALLIFLLMFIDRFSLKIPSTFSILITFLCVCVGWIYFRADNIYAANKMIAEIFHFTKGYTLLYTSNDIHGLPGTFLGLPFFSFVYTLLLVPVFFYLEHFIASNKVKKFHNFPAYIKWGVYYVAILSIIFLGVFDTRQFIYFQF
ncbi:MAG: MBOAT family O-acyltransferase [Chitinophagaceae bacterium]